MMSRLMCFISTADPGVIHHQKWFLHRAMLSRNGHVLFLRACFLPVSPRGSSVEDSHTKGKMNVRCSLSKHVCLEAP